MNNRNSSIVMHHTYCGEWFWQFCLTTRWHGPFKIEALAMKDYVLLARKAGWDIGSVFYTDPNVSIPYPIGDRT